LLRDGHGYYLEPLNQIQHIPRLLLRKHRLRPLIIPLLRQLTHQLPILQLQLKAIRSILTRKFSILFQRHSLLHELAHNLAKNDSMCG
jgi:hypothetical protein